MGIASRFVREGIIIYQLIHRVTRCDKNVILIPKSSENRNWNLLINNIKNSTCSRLSKILTKIVDNISCGCISN